MSEEKDKLWGRDPGWWSALFSAIQLFVLTIILGSFNWLLDLHAKRASLANEIHKQKVRLTEDDPQIYRPAFEAMASLGTDGLAAIHAYVRDHNTECIRWSKAMLIASKLMSRREQAGTQSDVAAMIHKSWSCHPTLLGDAQLYELVAHYKETLCNFFFNTDERDGYNLEMRRLHFAALIAAFRQCPNPPNKVEQLVSKFRAEFASPPPGVLQVDGGAAYWFEVLPTHDSEMLRDSEIWSGMWSGMVKLYHEAGKDADQTFWYDFDLDFAGLREKLIVTQLEYVSVRNNKELNTRLDSYIGRALKSRDSATRVAGIRAVANTQWTRYKRDLVRLAQSDSDPDVSGEAELILSFLQTQSTWNHR